MRPTQFMYSSKDGMVLRSGKIINSLENSQLRKDCRKLLKNEFDVNKFHHNYCEQCRKIIGLFDFLERYHKEIKGEETNIHGNGNKTWIDLHTTIKNKLQEFIMQIDTIVICNCDNLDHASGGAIYNNICKMLDLAEQDKYSKMANYEGYGRERELYRIYHKNFFVSYEPGDGTFVIGRDFNSIKRELQHWYTYFAKPHHSVTEVTEMTTTTLLPHINNNCISVVLSFLVNK